MAPTMSSESAVGSMASITILPLGAIGGVTGSAYLVSCPNANVLVDFGMFQGTKQEERKNRIPPELNVKRLDAVLVTHCHLDHVGRLPLLVKAGYNGPIYVTEATRELTELILRDAAHLQESDINRLNRKRIRQDLPPLEPLFTVDDVERLGPLYRTVRYHEPVQIAPGIQGRFYDAGHILGSATIELQISLNGKTRSLVFSGDLGQLNSPILRDFECVDRADVVIMESTYGDHDHKPIPETIREFEEIISTAVAQRAKVLVPTFAVGRAQVILYCLGDLFKKGAVATFPVFLDSPMAIEATKIYERHPELFDLEALQRQREHSFIRDFPSLKVCPTAADSQAINNVSGPCLIMAGSGMCTGGRILHHLKHNLWRPETWVIIVGYQANGTLGRLLLEGAKKVKILGETVAVKAKIRSLGGFSAHAGQKDLLNWLACLVPARPRVILTHGEDQPRKVLAQEIAKRFNLAPEIPAPGEPIQVI